MKKNLNNWLREVRTLRRVIPSVLIDAFLGMFFATTPHISSAATEILMPDERLWLAQNEARIVLGVETGYAPFVFIGSDGQPTGLAQDYIHSIETKLGVNIDQRRFSSLNDIFDKVRVGEINIVNAITKTPWRSSFLNITDPFISVPNVILVRKDRSGVVQENDLPGLTISLVRSYAVTEYLTNKGIAFVPDLVPDDLTALLNVSFGRADAAVIDLATASYLISQHGITNLRVAGEASFDIRLSMGVPLNEPVLFSILQKGLAAITEAERKEIHDRWVNTSGQSILFDRRVWIAIGGIAFVVVVVIVLVVIWNYALRRQVTIKTEALAKEQAEYHQRLEREISERTVELSMANRSLAVASERLTLATAGTHVGIWDYDVMVGTCVYDDEMMRLYGLEGDGSAITFGNWLSTIHPDDRDRVTDDVSAGLKGERQHDVEFRITLPDGSSRYIKTMGQVHRDEANSPVRMVGISYDITERKRFEHDLNEAKLAAEQANNAKSAFLATMSHELRTPLTAILGFANLTARDSGLTDRQRENLEIIRRSGEHLLTLINDVLDMSKIEAGKITVVEAPCDLHQLIDDVGGMMASRAGEKGLTLIVDRNEAPARTITTAPGKLRQILINLVGNAVKFTDRGGVVLRARTRPVGDGRLLLTVEVEDTGRGIAPQDLERVFEWFTQADGRPGDQTGTGLGLTITRAFIQALGGEIRVSSELGRGSVFSFTVPVTKTTEPDVPRPEPQRLAVGLAPGQPEIRALVVDDNSEGRRLLGAILASLGITVIEAVDGLDGINALSRCLPQLVCMDIRMPVMDGYEAVVRMRGMPQGQNCKVIAVSASVFDDERAKCMKFGFDDFLRKPLREAELFAILERHLGLRLIWDDQPNVGATAVAEPDSLALANVVDAWRRRFRHAVITGRINEISTIIDELPPEDHELATSLQKLTTRYEFDRILRLLTTEGNA